MVMKMTFEEAMRQLLNDPGLDAARGGVIIKHDDGRFACRLHNQPDDERGELFLELNPSATPEVSWRVWPVREEAQQEYRAFISNPNNGQLNLAE